MNTATINFSLDWDKMNNLMPVIIQHSKTHQVLMLGYMNQEALQETLTTQKVTFYSRSKKRLWTKGETSGNYLQLISIDHDCDQDCLLIQANPQGPCCHLGSTSCFANDQMKPKHFIPTLETIINKRKSANDVEASYTMQLIAQGINRIAQKVGEEGVEVAIAAVSQNKKQVITESADLIYHLLILLNQFDITFSNIEHELRQRNARV